MVMSKAVSVIALILGVSVVSLTCAEGVQGSVGATSVSIGGVASTSSTSTSVGAQQQSAIQSLMQSGSPSVAETVSAMQSDVVAKSIVDMPDAANQERINHNDDSQLKSEFQMFVAQSVGQSLPMYGYNLFRGAPNTFAPVDRVPVTSDYTIGPGDELQVNIWGQVNVNKSFVVDRNGVINIPTVASVSVVGVRYQNLQAHLKAAIGKVYRNFDMDVTLGKLRSIQVFVVGQASRPGSYTVSAMSTLVNALFVTGGPSVKGSMRQIQVKRSNKVVTTFDLYDLLLKGDKSKDVQLLPGDVIYIPTIGSMAAIAGSVNTPAIYELKGGESLADLIDLAGGLTNVAAGKKVAVERIQDREMRKVAEFQLDKNGLSKTMQDGDLVTVYSISARFDNAITLRGNIANPGRYPWKDGLRVSDVVPDKSALITDYYWAKQNQAARVDIKGNDKLRNEVKRSLPEINWDYAVVERLNVKDLTTSLIPFNLSRAIIEHDPEQNVLLQQGDVITIFSKDDIAVPANRRTKYVVLEGELERPGVYQTQPGETLRQLLARVGGLSPSAFLLGAEFSRESTRQMQQKRMDEIIQRLEVGLQRSASQAKSLDATDREANKAQLASQQALIDKMKLVKASGRIVLELPEQDAQVKDLPDVALEDGDRLYVPPMPSTVSVMGTVYNQNSFIYKSGMSINDYLAKAGGPTQDGDGSDTYMIRVDGKVFSKRQSTVFLGVGLGGFGSRQVLPGDTIVVPEKLDKYNLTKEFKDWTQIFYQFAVGVASLKTLNIF